MLKSRVSRISGRSGSPSDAPASSIRYGSIARLYSHRAGISRIFGLFSIGTLGKGGGSKCGVRVGGLRLGLRVGVYTVTVTVSLGYFSI